MNVEQNQEFPKPSAAARLRAGMERVVDRKTLREQWRALLRKPLMAAAFLFSVAAAVYWLLIASDRYVSESRVIVQKTDLSVSASPDIGALLTGSGAGNRSDQLIMREYLLSRDVVARLDEKLSLAEHYSAWDIDPFSRLMSKNSSNALYRFYVDSVTVEYDEYSGVLVVRSEAFDPEMAEKITSNLIEEGAAFMNGNANRLAKEQVDFLQGEVESLRERAQEARQAMVAYQNRERIASPEAQAESITAIVAQLEARRSELQVQLASQSAFLVEDHPVLVEIRRQIAAIDRQIAQQNARLASPQGALNSKMEQFAILEADATFAEELYRTALAALEKGQVESTRTIKTLTIVQQPNLPQQAERPDRLRKTFTYAIFAFLIAGVLQLLVMIIRDHRD